MHNSPVAIDQSRMLYHEGRNEFYVDSRAFSPADGIAHDENLTAWGALEDTVSTYPVRFPELVTEVTHYSLEDIQMEGIPLTLDYYNRLMAAATRALYQKELLQES